MKNTEGSAIRRIGHQRWLRNLAVGLGNASFDEHIVSTLEKAKPDASPLVSEHINWAISEQLKKREQNKKTQRLIKAIEKGLPRDA